MRNPGTRYTKAQRDEFARLDRERLHAHRLSLTVEEATAEALDALGGDMLLQEGEREVFGPDGEVIVLSGPALGEWFRTSLAS